LIGINESPAILRQSAASGSKHPGSRRATTAAFAGKGK